MAKEQLLCQNCSAPIELHKIKGLKCPYCGGSLLHKKSDKYSEWQIANSKYPFERIIPFKKQKEDIIKKVTDHISYLTSHAYYSYEQRLRVVVSKNLLKSLSFDVKKVYVPFWEVSISYQTSADNIQDYYFLASANSNFQICTEQRLYGAYYVTLENPLKIKYLLDKDVPVYEIDIDNEEVLKKKEVNNFLCDAKDNASRRLSVKTIYGLDFWRYNKEEEHKNPKASNLLVAIWILQYEYEGKKYEIFVEGGEGHILKASYPQIPQKDDKDEEESVLRITRLILLLLFFIFLIWLIYAFWVNP